MKSRSTRTWRILGLELALGEDEALLRERAAQAVGLSVRELRGFRLVKKALDARVRGGVRRMRFVVHADLVLDQDHGGAAFARARRSGRVIEAPPTASLARAQVHESWRGANVAVLGAGPAGLFAALVLARHGVATTLIERGSAVETRSKELVRFHRTRTPHPESNLLFGEGGAGTYSDGKIYTRVDDPLEIPILEELVACGAPASIVYDARAHIGTDRLHVVLPALRELLRAAGVRFAWNTRIDDVEVAAGAGQGMRRVRAYVDPSGAVACDALVMAPGHSARDTWTWLARRGVAFEAKPFQLGLRIEHPQALVDHALLGPDAATLGAASYALVARAGEASVGAHSFCMCPGGRIVASVSESGRLCTNGMSNSTHSSPWANAALVATFGPREFGDGAFAGVAFQDELERRFFALGGGDYTAPAQRASDFLAGRASSGRLASSYVLGLRAERLDEHVPPLLRDALRAALARFDRVIPGFAGDDGLFVGLESRSSGPVRMPRDPATRRARGFENLYPVGEGAGYAGGIMSAALDGARSALRMLELGRT